MKKSALRLLSGSILTAFLALHFFCIGFDSPSSPDKTNASVVLMSSTSKIFEGALVDSVGKEIGIGFALYLPANFDSVNIQVLDNGNTVIDTICKTFRSDYFKDTVWIKHTFLKPGVKNITVTPYSTPQCPSIGATITIHGIEQIPEDITPPAITFVSPSDTNAAISADTFTVDLLCSDPSGVASVSASMGSKTFQPILINGHYTIQITGFTRGVVNVVTITAMDSSATGNTASRKLYFNYQASGYSVMYQKGSDVSGDLPVDSRMYQSGEQVIVLGNTGNLTRSGFTFSGWNTKEDGTGTAYTGGTAFQVGNADVVLFTQWTTMPVYKVVYNGNGHTGGDVPVDSNNYLASTMVTVKENSGSLSKAGATFIGWNTVADGSGPVYSGGSTFAIGSANVVLYAQWTTNPTFTIMYNGNGNTTGNVPVDANKYEASALVMVKENSGLLAKPGFSFTGWNTALDGSGTAYAGGGTFEMGNANLVLYAQWTIAKYTVTFNSMEGSAVDSQTVDHGGNVTEPAAPGRTGYTFGGWYKEAACTTQWNFTTETIISNDTLFAKWVAVTYTITFDDQSATTHVSPAAKTVTFPLTTVGTLPSAPAKTGYTFCCWNTAANGSGSEFTALTTVTANITVYAIWNSHSYTVTYDGQSVVANSTKIVTSPKTTVETLPAPAASGYQFGGWFTGANGSGSPFLATTTVSGDITVFANWIRVYKVTYNVNTGNGTPPVDPNSYPNGSTVAVLSSSGLSKENYIFAGWNTQEDTLGASYTGGVTFEMASADVVLYAKWRMNVPTVATMPNKTCPVNDSVTFSVTATGAELSYKWYLNDSEIASGNSFTTSKLTTADVSGPRTYKCVVTNPAGSVNSSATLSVSTVNDADNNVYHEVKIGTQIWMMENLKTTRYRDGSRIGSQSADASGWVYNYNAYAWPEYNESNKVYGMLYNWNCVNGGILPPAGWRIATENDWSTLFTANGGCDLYDPDYFNVSIEYGCSSEVEPNNTGFTATANGTIDSTGEAGYSFRRTAYWWVSETRVASMEYSRSWSMNVSDYNVTPDNGYGIRCVKE